MDTSWPSHLGRYSLLLASCLLPINSNADPFFTDFEGINDSSGEFFISAGDPEITTTFFNGEAFTAGNFDLYFSGFVSWMVAAGNTGSIQFDQPVADISLWLRDEPGSSAASTLQVYDADNQLLATSNGSQSEWSQIVVSVPEGDPGIVTITLEHTGADGWSVIDDLQADNIVSGGGDPLEDPIPEPIADGLLKVGLMPVASNLTAPNWGISAPGHNNHLFVTDQSGIVWKINTSGVGKQVFLDVSDRLVELGIAGPNSFDERGLLGVAFHPNYQSNGLLYTYTSEPTDSGSADYPVPLGAAADHHSVITEWQVNNPTHPAAIVDASSARELLRIGQPQFNHDGGAINYGPGGLYISLGDGGNADDEGDGHVAGGNGQDASNALGTVLRIDPDGNNGSNGQYGIPASNPFVGDASLLEEIYAYGFRNPFRFSFDMANQKLYLADVGQNDIEEVDIVSAGGNYGWPLKEGSFFFNGNGSDPGFVTDQDPGVPAGLIDPVVQYDHDEGTAIIGGFVYRGSAIPALNGRYLFGDYALTFSNDGRLFYKVGAEGLRELQLVGGDLNLSLLGFGQDANGEVYVMGNTTGVPFGDTGVVYKLVPLSP